MYKIRVKFADEVFCPSNAIAGGFYKLHSFDNVQFLTADEVKCTPTIVSCTNNQDGSFDEQFDDFCRRHFSVSWDRMAKLWYQRLGYCDDYWYWIKLKRA